MGAERAGEPGVAVESGCGGAPPGWQAQVARVVAPTARRTFFADTFRLDDREVFQPSRSLRMEGTIGRTSGGQGLSLERFRIEETRGMRASSSLHRA